MIGRKDFTTPEWQELQTAVIGTISYITLANHSFFGDIKNHRAADQAINEYLDETKSSFIKELTDFDNYNSPIPKFARDSSEGLEPVVLRSITNSVASIKKHDPTSVNVFKNFILDIAYKTAVQSNISPEENTGLKKIAIALESQPEPVAKKWNPSDPFAKV